MPKLVFKEDQALQKISSDVTITIFLLHRKGMSYKLEKVLMQFFDFLKENIEVCVFTKLGVCGKFLLNC